MVVIDYDREDTPDQGEVGSKLNQIANCPYDADNVNKWLCRLERRMETGGIGGQWTKRLVLESALPAHLHEELDELFDKRKSECGRIFVTLQRMN